MKPDTFNGTFHKYYLKEISKLSFRKNLLGKITAELW